jgi:hypothetical protein
MSDMDSFQEQLTPEMKLRLTVAKGRRHGPGGDPRIDTLMNMLMALTSEVSILRERVDAHERLQAEGKFSGPESVDDYTPDEAVQKVRGSLRQRLIAKVCRPLLAEANSR